ncbi:MAG: Six-hairpin glycosidase-like protein [Proteobacteria bacterium]|nr:Six-hairpin glycosidase-like protein [Pseudomonadota bacterium]
MRRAGWRFAALLLGSAASYVAMAQAAAPAHERLEWQGRWVEATRLTDEPAARFRLESGEPGVATRSREVGGRAGGPWLRSDSALFDAAFALALAEAGEDSVTEIRDGAFADGRPIPCVCFETGAKWPYVWTRDVSYSTDLALADLDAKRAWTSLLFKVSAARAGADHGARLVAQDTGSGGSWPISTDRVVWIHAARAAVAALPAPAGAAAGRELRRIARATLAQDRAFAFDPRAGLYRGETSFLDWREQTYPAWTRDDTAWIGESFSLSTNVLHFLALQDLAALARDAGEPDAAALADEARALQTRIATRFWRPTEHDYASYLAPDLEPVASSDLLALALAVTSGVADASRARAALARYSLAAGGPPVIAPQQPEPPIYHNRAVWPFVTAYALAAARELRDPGRMDAYAESLLRGAALSLSNMENFEFLTQRTAFDDGPRSGPVITSPRQLWSVAGYWSGVVHELLGLRPVPGAVTIAPSIPGAFARRHFAPGDRIAVGSLTVGGVALEVNYQLPATWRDGDVLEAGRVASDGTLLRLPASLARDSGGRPRLVEVALVARPAAGTMSGTVAVADPHALSAIERARLFAPPPPEIAAATRSADGVELSITGLAPGAGWIVSRDGVTVGSGDAAIFRERPPDRRRMACYRVVQRDPAGGLVSLPGRERCLPGSDHQHLAAGEALRAAGHSAEDLGAGRKGLRDWGAPSDRLELEFVATAPGLHRLVLRYLNDAGPVNTGITAAVKRVVARCGAAAESGTLVMPHRPRGEEGVSTGFVFAAPAGARCRVEIEDGFNMSYLEHFALYTGGRGGREGPHNRADVLAAEVDAIARPRLAVR